MRLFPFGGSFWNETGLTALRIGDDCRLAGMLHDAGKLLLAANMPNEFSESRQLAKQQGIPIHEAETRIYGANHADVGAYLLDLWGFPHSIVEGIAFHHTPSLSTSDDFTILTAMHISNALSHHAEHTDPSIEFDELDSDYIQRLKLEDCLGQWQESMSVASLSA